MGLMIMPGSSLPGYLNDYSFAMDNGAYSCYVNGLPFDEYAFLKILSDSRKFGIPDFVVIPDIVGQGKKSLEISKTWLNRLYGYNLALAVQDGMMPSDIDFVEELSYIFVGGSVKWKWETIEMWVEFAHRNGLKIHVGKVGRLDYLKRAKELGVDSVDSSSFARNDSWHILEEFKKPQQELLFA